MRQVDTKTHFKSSNFIKEYFRNGFSFEQLFEMFFVNPHLDNSISLIQ